MSNFVSIPHDFSAISHSFPMFSLEFMNIRIRMFSYLTIR